jgi:hypothetical protein
MSITILSVIKMRSSAGRVQRVELIYDSTPLSGSWAHGTKVRHLALSKDTKLFASRARAHCKDNVGVPAGSLREPKYHESGQKVGRILGFE